MLDAHYRALDLTPGAPLSEVRSAYRNLVQVWHPDRFVSNPKLQAIAQVKLRTINAAYECLVRELEKRPPPGSAVRPPAAAGMAQAAACPQPAPRRTSRLRSWWQPRTTLAPQFAAFLATVMVCWWLFSGVESLWRSSLPPAARLESVNVRPIPSPASLLDAADSLRSASRLFDDWALFQQERSGLPASVPGGVVPDQGGSITVTRDAGRGLQHPARPGGPAARQPVTRTTSDGAGEVEVTNTTPLDAVVELLPEGGSHAKFRRLPVPAGGVASLKGIEVGVYELVVRSGHGYRDGRFSNLISTRLLARLQFLRVQDVSGIRGDRYSVILWPQ